MSCILLFVFRVSRWFHLPDGGMLSITVYVSFVNVICFFNSGNTPQHKQTNINKPDVESPVTIHVFHIHPLAEKEGQLARTGMRTMVEQRWNTRTLFGSCLLRKTKHLLEGKLD